MNEAVVIEIKDIHVASPSDVLEEAFRDAKCRLVDQFEKSYLERILVLYRGNIASAARAAKKNRRAFWQLMHKHGITAGRFRVIDSNDNSSS